MRILVKMRSGSHLYGTSTPQSDVDLKGVHLPPANDILLQRVLPAIKSRSKVTPDLRNTAGDTDSESFSLQKFLQDLLAGQPVALSMLFTPDSFIFETTDVWDEIRGHKRRWLHRSIKPMANFCRHWANASKIPPKNDTQTDWKGMAHAVRMCHEAEELLTHHVITYPRPEAELLVRIRSGVISQKDLAEMIGEGVGQMEKSMLNSTLPESPDALLADTVVAAQYRLEITNSS